MFTVIAAAAAAAAEKHVLKKSKTKMSYTVLIESDRNVDTDVKNNFSFTRLERSLKRPIKSSGEMRMEEFRLRDFFKSFDSGQSTLRDL